MKIVSTLTLFYSNSNFTAGNIIRGPVIGIDECAVQILKRHPHQENFEFTDR